MSEISEAQNAPETEPNKPIYHLAILESTAPDGTRRQYLPVLATKHHDFYESYQCAFAGIEGTLDEVMDEANMRVAEDESSGRYTSVYLQTPEERVLHRPNDREYVFAD